MKLLRLYKVCLVCLVIMVHLCSESNAQALFTNQSNFTIFDGLSNNHITVVFQDSRGFIWVGTEDGLNRYDGSRILVFRHDPLDSTSISGNHIQCIAETKDGNIWIGTQGFGLNVWERQKDRFTQFVNNPNKSNSLPENDVCGLLVNDDQTIWIKTLNFLVNLDVEKKSFTSFGHFSNLFKPIKHRLFPLLNGDNSTLWVGTKDGLNKFSLKENTFSRVVESDEKHLVDQNPTTGLIRYTNNTLLVSTKTDVNTYHIPSNTFTKIINIEGENADVGLINAMLLGSNRRYWLGTNKGLRFIEEGSIGANISNRLIKTVDFVNDEVTALFEDFSGILWVGTKHNGLYKIDQRTPKFFSISAKSQFSNLGSYHIKSLLIDQDNKLWLGTSDDGIYILDRKTGESQHLKISDSNQRLNESAIQVLYSDSKNVIWIGTNHGLYTYNSNLKVINEFDYGNNKEFETLLKDNVINCLAEDRLNNLWIGTKFGLYKYNGQTLESYFSETQDPNSLCADEINALLTDKEGWLWIGTNNGLNIYKPDENGMFIRMKNSTSQPHLLSNNYVLSLKEGLNGEIWVGTRSGLTAINKTTNITKSILSKDGLENDVINGILTDDDGRVWISTNNGLSLIGNNNDVLNFSIEEGLAGYVFSHGAVFKSKEGELLFGGVDGVSYLYPKMIELNLNKPKTAITSIVVSNKGEIVERWTGEPQSIEYKYQNNSSIRIDFSGLEFTQPLKNRYKIFLEGFDDHWSEVSYQNHISYSNLPSGEYIFKVKAANNDLVWGENIAEVKIKIVSPLWRSNIAIAFYIIAFVFLLQTIVNYRVRFYRKAYHSLREKAVDKRKIEVQRETLSKINKSLTDSINYAKRIQEAMLPSDQMVKSLLPESLIYYRPKDIVSGDFYYYFKRNNSIFVAAVDCTGHGVPGAFMSIIGFDLLKNIIEIQRVDCPSTILKYLNRQLFQVFKKDRSETAMSQLEVNDGMDISIAVIDYDKQTVEYAGANNSLYLLRDNEIESYDGNRYPIGYSEDGDVYTKQVIPFLNNDLIYLFSDGYADQFGGPDGKKFKYRRFRHLLLNVHKLPFDDQKAILHQKMEEWKMGDTHEQVDDMLLIGFKLVVEKKIQVV